MVRFPSLAGEMSDGQRGKPHVIPAKAHVIPAKAHVIPAKAGIQRGEATGSATKTATLMVTQPSCRQDPLNQTQPT